MTNTREKFVALLRHGALFQLLSRARAHPVNPPRIFRGLAAEDEPDIFRLAATLDEEPVPPGDSDWRATFKHHLALGLRAVSLHSSGAIDHMAASALWRKGALSFIASAPRSVAGKWRITRGSDSPITGDCVLVVLDWVGNDSRGPPSRQRDAPLSAAGWRCGR